MSLVIQAKLNNPRDHVVIQPLDSTAMFGGYAELNRNKETCKAQFTTVDHVLRPGEAEEILALVSKPFDLVVADCEGCLCGEYVKNPSLFDHVLMIQVERDDSRNEYDQLMETLAMRKIHTGPHEFFITVEVWVRDTCSKGSSA